MNKYLLFQSNEDSIKSVPEGEKKLFKAGGKSICVARWKSELVAFENLCPHMNAPLHNGRITPFGEISCPLHEYRFSLKNGQESNSRCGDLKFVSLRLLEEKWYLEL